ncbi:MAG: phosphoenolpyruvate synthase [Candidatus Nealsonbacteria bacterium RBG_13_37_56]|uniref:Phosphoenolpyruvate synthase n=1 Tax=Candidatus Nealsonbacteria bacterium RBG_13_37_56 TaxID=1801661 RepID=A0A1G2DYI8_9BACT|nr:MAG: phosphoenolpyruvate synthase [Candidatus Nealsonbacteria bacterium RBG_13_37_56]
MLKKLRYILWYKEINKSDGPLVGGKNASLGEMARSIGREGVNLPDGFCLTSRAFWYFLKNNKIDKEIKDIFSKFDPKDLKSLRETGKASRDLILKAEFPKDLKKKIIKSYKKLSRKYKQENTDVAVRSSATAEDLATASFAGQMESFLNIKGEEQLLKAVKECIASLFTDRSISYREEKGFDHLKIALSVGIQKMIRSDLSSSGIMFTLDTETGFENVVLINSIWGIGELIVKGKITPDEFYVFKPTLEKGFKSIIVKNLGRKNKKYIYAKNGGLEEAEVKDKDQLKFSLNDKDIITLARWACKIEKHYGRHQDIEWAKDGKTGDLFIVQSRPETIHTLEDAKIYKEYIVKSKKNPIITGIAIGDKIGIGKVKLISDVSKITDFKQGEVLVTKMTDPDWVPIMRLASAIVTDEGGKTCHAAIVARELGIPTVVGTNSATKELKTGQKVTVDCTQGMRGRIFEGEIPFEVKKYDLKKIPELKTKIMMNIGAPEIAFKSSFLPNSGVGLAREEFIIAEKIRVHPLALYNFKNLKNKKLKKEIEEITVEHKDKKEYFIKELAEGIAQIGAAFYPKEVIVRFSDFKTNEYRNLIGGDLFEGEESNPMLGFRGASRYINEQFQPAFKMECQAIKRAREDFGLTNINVMVPFCRTVEEGRKTLDLIKKFGLDRRSLDGGGSKLKIYVMCEIPSNVILVEEFLKIFDGMSIGSNDLTQLVLGLDRDNGQIAYIGNETNEAVKRMLIRVIRACKKNNKYCGICGQGPSDIPEFAEFLQDQGIESMSLNPDTVIKTIMNLSKK